MTEEECAVILAKLEEIGKKLDDNNRKIDDNNRKLDGVNAQLRCVSKSSGQSASASSSSSLTSSPPQDGSLVASIATLELSPTAPTRCSTPGPNQDACVDARVSASASTTSASPTASSISSPPQDAALVASLVTMELPPSAPTKCSTLGLYQAGHILESATLTMAAAPLTASSTSTMPQDVFLTNKIATTKPSAAVLARRSTYGRSSDMRVPEPQFTSPAATLLLSVDKSHDLNTVGHQFKEMCQDYLSDVGKIFNKPPDDAIHGKGHKVFKPPWLLYTSWFRGMQLVSGYLLEMSPWCRECVVLAQLRSSWLPLGWLVNTKCHQCDMKVQLVIAGEMFQIRTDSQVAQLRLKAVRLLSPSDQAYLSDEFMSCPNTDIRDTDQFFKVMPDNMYVFFTNYVVIGNMFYHGNNAEELHRAILQSVPPTLHYVSLVSLGVTLHSLFSYWQELLGSNTELQPMPWLPPLNDDDT